MTTPLAPKIKPVFYQYNISDCCAIGVFSGGGAGIHRRGAHHTMIIFISTPYDTLNDTEGSRHV